MADTLSRQQKGKRWGDILKFVVFIAIGFLFIYWFLLKLPPEQKQEIWASFKSADYAWVAVTMAVCLASHFVRALRWRLLYKPLGREPRLLPTFGAVVVAYMANMAFPRLGEVLRCAVLRTSDGIAVEKSLGTVITERITDVVLNALIILVGTLLIVGDIREWVFEGLSAKADSLPSTTVVIAAIVAAGVIAVALYKLLYKRLLKYAFFSRIDKLLRGMFDGVKSILHLDRRSAVLYFVYSALIYGFYILGGLVMMQAFPETSGLGFNAAFLLYFLGSVGMMFSQGGIGVYPVLVQMALAVYAVPKAAGLACGWLLWGAQQAVVIAVGMLFMIYFSIAKRKSKDAVVE